MKRALVRIRESLTYRRDAFVSGLRKAGFSVQAVVDKPTPEDILVIWNRYGLNDSEARRFEAAKARVIVAENGYFGKAWNGGTWFALAQDHHCGAGYWYQGADERWNSLSVRLEPFRTTGTELVILAQRGIGEPGIVPPTGWDQQMQRRYGGRIRKHPGNANVDDLLDDLQNAASVMTWSSGAALKALVYGIPVWFGLEGWVGAKAGQPIKDYGKVEPNRSEADRLAMLRRLIWAQWRIEEIADGTAFSWLLRPKHSEFVCSDVGAFV